MPNVLSLDPGGTTGGAVIHYGPNSAPYIVEAFQIPSGLEGFLAWHADFKTQIDEIACEDFVLRPSVKFPDLSPVRIIGALEAIYHRTTIPITYQSPSIKPLCSDEVLKRIGFYQKGKGHANDAIRHAIIYLRSKKHRPTIEMAWPNYE